MTSFWKWRVDAELIKKGRADQMILQAFQLGLGEWLEKCEHPLSKKNSTALSRNLLQRLIKEERVTSKGIPIKANSKLRLGDEVQIEFLTPKNLELIPENHPIDVLYEDPYILVVNKSPNLTVHPSSTQTEGTLVHALLYHIKDWPGIGDTHRPGIVHRLDKNTSGALVIAKTHAAHQALIHDFSHHTIERRYWALCYGNLPSSLKIESLIGRSPSDRKKMSMQVKRGRRAITLFKVIEKYEQSRQEPFACLVEATLETGRTHQVRVHLTGAQHSILGDPTYGTPSTRHPKWLALPEEIRKKVTALPGQALHARILGIQHPISRKLLRFEAPPPQAFSDLLNSLRQYKRTSK